MRQYIVTYGFWGRSLFYRLLFVLFASAFIPAAASVAAAEQALDMRTLDARARSVYRTVMSPFCPGKLLEDCPTQDASLLKKRIRAQLASGATVAEVRAALFAEFGEEVRALPKGEGFDLAAWIVPIVFILGGGIVFTIWFRRHSVGREEEIGPSTLSNEMEARIEQELRQERK